MSCLLHTITPFVAMALLAGTAQATTMRKKPKVVPPSEAAPSEEKDIGHEFDNLSRRSQKDGRYYAGYGYSADMSLGSSNKATRDYNPLLWLKDIFSGMDQTHLRVLADYATVNPASGAFSYVGQGSQTGLVSLVPVMKRENSTVLVGAAYHYAAFHDELAPRFSSGNSWHAIVNRHDFALTGEFDYLVQSRFSLFGGLGAALQRRVLILYSDHDYAADDYYANFAPGYEATLGAEWALPIWEHEFLVRLFCHYMSGAKMATANLNYDDSRVNVNFAAYATGIAAGYAF